MKKVIPILLIIIGILFLLTPFITEQIIKYYSKSIISEEVTNEIIKANNQNDQLEVEFDFSAIEDVDIKSIIKGSMNFNRKLVIGTILIPDLDINLPIMKGLSDANLMVGAATMKLDQSFGLGNFTLAGHYMKNKDLLFGSLMDIEIGDLVYISDGEKIYEYNIYDTVVVLDTAMEMLSDKKAGEKGKPIISLMTCYYSSKTGKRFFALGELVDEYPID
ncbi:class A sortase [Clostridium sp. Cult2]|uniref:class A sortase n=1 Tax=Clostridium sp. Cult2 TaxID=2079003 RepID=UPI001F1B78BD|nr:class A sortase [Clostridium sp. Cult2]MCF6465489.1 class A sortase [Clostridium sp. Cult2]